MMDTHAEKVVLIGNRGVGKTSFVKRFVDSTFNENHTATVGFEPGSAVLEHHGRSVRIDLWTCGPEILQCAPIKQQFYKDAAAVIIMYDICRHVSFQDAANKWLSEAKEADLKHPVLMLVGHKYDKRPLRSVETDEGQAIADKHDMIFAEASALDGINVTESLMSILDAIDKKRSFYTDISTYCVTQEPPPSGPMIAFESGVNGHNPTDIRNVGDCHSETLSETQDSDHSDVDFCYCAACCDILCCGGLVMETVKEQLKWICNLACGSDLSAESAIR